MEISTRRLLLRPFGPDDADDLFAYLHEPSVHCFACIKLDTAAQAREAVAERSCEPLWFAIVLKETGRVIGEIFAEAQAAAPDQTDRDTFSPCWMLHPAFTGKGYMLEAARAFFDYLFNEAGARRIYTYTEDDNLPCQCLCERLGMRREGEFKAFVSFINDENGRPLYENTLQYAILKQEWLLRRRADEAMAAPTEQTKRIARMEQALDRSAAAVHAALNALEEYQAVLPELQALEAYYQSERWMQDFDDDAQGKLPPFLKRGVLSEDAVWELLDSRTRMMDILRQLEADASERGC